MRMTKLVPRLLFGRGHFADMAEFIAQAFPGLGSGFTCYLIDAVHSSTGLRKRLNPSPSDLVIDVDVSDHEPKTEQIDALRDSILSQTNKKLPGLIVGIGGGAVLDIAKAVSIMLTNPGLSKDYQGYDLPKIPPISKLAVPTLSGTGSESTRTAVLTGPEKKLGINSDYSMYNAILMDPDLLLTVPPEQEFYTGMDCFIHCVESLQGSLINELARGFATKSQELMENHFLKEKNYESLMVASYLGGCSVANSSVGICHAMSYGISLVLGYRHGLANTIVFNQLGEFYGEGVRKLKKMIKKHKVSLPTGVCKNVTPDQMDRMIAMTVRLERELTHALGENWKNILTREKIIELYNRM